MSPEEITETYNVLAEEAPAYTNALVDRAGMAQASLGTLADAVRGGSQTANVGNYTYNRLVRPTVNTLRDQLVVEGITQGMNAQISQALQNAKQNYQNARNAYARRSRGGSTGGGTGGSAGTGDVKFTEEVVSGSNYAPPTEEKAPNAQDYISNASFSNMRPLMGYSRKYPTTVDTDTFSTSFEAYTGGNTNNLDASKKWVQYLESIGYGG